MENSSTFPAVGSNKIVSLNREKQFELRFETLKEEKTSLGYFRNSHACPNQKHISSPVLSRGKKGCYIGFTSKGTELKNSNIGYRRLQ